IQETAEKYGYDILILNNRPTEENSSRIALADGAVMMGVNRDDKGIERLVKAHFPLVFVGRREVANAHTHWVTFAYQEVIEQMIDHLTPVCKKQQLVYVETKEQEREPRKDKRAFLFAATEKRGINVHVVEVDEQSHLSQQDLCLIKECQVAVFDRIFLLDSFERELSRNQLKLGQDVWGAVLEDDWIGGHEHWTRWSNQRLELGSLAVDYLSRLLEKKSLEGASKFTPLHLLIRESSIFPS
ncbi:MAG: LacI family DNA-binding transcriptional regulator, partial [Sphaerochaetaceae bacterium]